MRVLSSELRTLWLLAILWTAAVRPSLAGEPGKSESEQPAATSALRELFKDNFQSDTRNDYETQGKISWEAGHLRLHSPGYVNRKAEAGPTVAVDVDLEWPDLEKDGEQQITFLRFAMNGATDCLVGWHRTRQQGQTVEQVRIFDSAVKGGGIQLIPVREFAFGGTGRTWRVEYRYGLISILRGEALLGAGHISNSWANPVAVMLLQREGDSTLRLLSCEASTPAKPLSADDRRLLAEAQSHNKLRVQLTGANKLDEALAPAMRVVETMRQVFGEEHFAHAESLDNLAGLYQDLAQYAKAEASYEAARDIYRRLLGDSHPLYAMSLNNLAVMSQHMGDYAQAERLHVQAREIRKLVRGDQHPDYATSLLNLGALYQAMGQFARAEPLFVAACRIFERQVPRDDLYYAGALNNLASLYEMMGDLHFLPWNALPGAKPGTFLIQDYSLATALDGHQLYLTLTAPPLVNESRTLLVGDVDYDADTNRPAAPPPARDPVATAATEVRTRAAASGGKRLVWKPLAQTGKEIERIATLVGSSQNIQLLTQAAATENAARDALPRSRFVHLATHGFFANESFRSQFQDEAGEQVFGGPRDLLTRKQAGVTFRNPLLLSGIVLAGANRPPRLDSLGLDTGQDGILTAEEVVNLDLRKTELAVLSACETGLGRVGGGEGVFGLQRAFTLAGTRTTIASLWKVDDAATQALMTEFYRNLFEKKLGKLESLRQAQLSMIRRYMPSDGQLRAIDVTETVATKPATPASKSAGLATPFHWAAFSLSGDWR